MDPKINQETKGADLKLPSPIFRFNDKENDISNDNSKHQGRIRSFPHERGNWATFIYIDYNDSDGWIELQDECKALLTKASSLVVEPIEQMHLSLSKTVTLQYHNITPFVGKVRDRLARQRRFPVIFSGLQVYVNEERTRTFLGVRVSEDFYQELEKIVSELDETLRDYRLPVFYTERAFHVSILWCLGDREREMREQMEPLGAVFDRVYEEEYSDISRPVKTIWLKCGHKTFQFELVP
uniref:U6 snRNA phosphodiesterase n=1 Tax=Anopheles farauti TaxID=69004 RepID=A0A182QX31_9DIPT